MQNTPYKKFLSIEEELNSFGISPHNLYNKYIALGKHLRPKTKLQLDRIYSKSVDVPSTLETFELNSCLLSLNSPKALCQSRNIFVKHVSESANFFVVSSVFRNSQGSQIMNDLSHNVPKSQDTWQTEEENDIQIDSAIRVQNSKQILVIQASCNDVLQKSSDCESPNIRPRRGTDSSQTPSKGILKTSENFSKPVIEVPQTNKKVRFLKSQNMAAEEIRVWRILQQGV